MKRVCRLCLYLLAAAMALTFISACESRVITWEDAFPYSLDDYVKIGQYKGIEVETESREATEADLQKKISEILDVYSTFALSDSHAASQGDKVIIDYTGTINGETFSGGSGKDVTVVIGSGSFIKGFEEGLIGVKKGDVTKLELTFPEDYANTSLAGKDVVFDVTVRSVYKKTVPEFTDSFVVSNFPYGSAEEYKRALAEEINQTKPAEVEAKKLEDCWSIVRSNFTVFNLPHDDAQNYYYSNYYSYLVYAQYMEMDLDELIKKLNMTKADFESMLWKDAYEEEEELIVALSICREENLTISEELYKRKLDEYAVEWGYESAADFKKRVGKSIEEQYGAQIIYRYIFVDLAREFAAADAVEIPISSG